MADRLTDNDLGAVLILVDALQQPAHLEAERQGAARLREAPCIETVLGRYRGG